MFLTPWLISLVADANGGIDLGKTLIDLSLLLLLPLVLGQALRPLWGKFFARYKRYTAVFDKLVILLLVFASFSDSVAGGIWQQQGPETLVIAFVGSALLLALMLGHHPLGAGAGFQPRGRDRRGVLRHQEIPGGRRAHGGDYLRRQPGAGPDTAADHALPPDAADRLLGDGRALRQPWPRTEPGAGERGLTPDLEKQAKKGRPNLWAALNHGVAYIM